MEENALDSVMELNFMSVEVMLGVGVGNGGRVGFEQSAQPIMNDWFY